MGVTAGVLFSFNGGRGGVGSLPHSAIFDDLLYGFLVLCLFFTLERLNFKFKFNVEVEVRP